MKSKCKYLLSTTWYNVNDPQYHTRHAENREVATGRFYPVCLSSEPFNLPAPDFYFEEHVVVDNHDAGNRKGLGFWNLEDVRKRAMPPLEVTPNLTLVTGLWDIGRPGRTFDHYIENFKKFKNSLLKTYILIAFVVIFLAFKLN